MKHEELNTNQVNISKHFLEEYIHESRIIGQYIKKIGHQFVVVTVYKNLILDYWSAHIYVPKTCRNFLCYMSNPDLLKLKRKDF